MRAVQSSDFRTRKSAGTFVSGSATRVEERAMVHRRQVLAGPGAGAPPANVPGKLSAATPIKPDNEAALLVIDVQNCFLPGGSLAVKDGDQVVPIINKIAKSFFNVVMTQDWHTEGQGSLASSHSVKKAVERIDLY